MKNIKNGIWKEEPYYCSECGAERFEKVYYPSEEEIKEQEIKDKIRSKQLIKSLTKQEKKYFGKYNKILSKVSVKSL